MASHALCYHTVSNSIFFENLEEVTFLGGFTPNLLLSGSMMNMLILYISARYFCDLQNPLICHLKYSSLWSFIQFSCHVCHQYLIFVPFSSSCLKEPSLFLPLNNFICYICKGSIPYNTIKIQITLPFSYRGHHGCDHMIVGFTTTCAIRWCVLDTTLCDIVCQKLVTGQCFSMFMVLGLWSEVNDLYYMAT